MRSSLSLSLIFHALFLALCFVLSTTASKPRVIEEKQPMWVELEPVPPPAGGETRKQIVQTERGRESSVAPDKALLGERNQKVERETVAKTRSLISDGSSPRAQQQKKAATPKVALSALGLAMSNPMREALTENAPQWANFGSIAQDYVRGVADGDRTLLNTKEYVFFGYFQRIRERLDRAWVPILKERISQIYRKGRSLASDMEHSTKVLVTLNKTGEIIRVRVLSESGTRDLDEAAINAFNQAGPFPNPPKGIVDPNGEIEIPWEFILKT